MKKNVKFDLDVGDLHIVTIMSNECEHTAPALFITGMSEILQNRIYPSCCLKIIQYYLDR